MLQLNYHRQKRWITGGAVVALLSQRIPDLPSPRYPKRRFLALSYPPRACAYHPGVSLRWCIATVGRSRRSGRYRRRVSIVQVRIGITSQEPVILTVYMMHRVTSASSSALSRLKYSYLPDNSLTSTRTYCNSNLKPCDLRMHRYILSVESSVEARQLAGRENLVPWLKRWSSEALKDCWEKTHLGMGLSGKEVSAGSAGRWDRIMATRHLKGSIELWLCTPVYSTFARSGQSWNSG